MDIFGIGPLEFVLILIIMLIILGPNDMVKAGRSIGTFLRKLILSDEWRIIQQAGKEFRNIPERLVREAGIEDIKKDLPSAEDLRKELPTMEEITAQTGINELQRDLQQDFNKTIQQAKMPVSIDEIQPPAAPAEPLPPTPAAPAEAPKSYEAFMQKPAQTPPAQPLSQPVPQKPAQLKTEPIPIPEEEPEYSPWVNPIVDTTPETPPVPENRESQQSQESPSSPDQP